MDIQPSVYVPPSATVDHMLAAGYKLLDWLNFYWNFYVVFMGVIIGWLFNAKEGWISAQQVAVTVLIVGFAAVSLNALWRTYLALNATTSELRTRWGTDDSFKRAILARLSQKGWQLAIGLHTLLDATVIYFVWTVARRAV